VVQFAWLGMRAKRAILWPRKGCEAFARRARIPDFAQGRLSLRKRRLLGMTMANCATAKSSAIIP